MPFALRTMFISIVLSMSRIGAVDFAMANATISSKDKDERIDWSFVESIANAGVAISAAARPITTPHGALLNSMSAPTTLLINRSVASLFEPIRSHAGGTEAAGAAHRLAGGGAFGHPRLGHRRNYHLGDAHAAFDDEGFLAEIGEQHLHFAAIVAVDGAG
ncbi:hypothetical protein RHECNPAF_25300113 [Rhizobium etli CNPAF512]|nr:hypothetical protein RHECNPAF_25300113 [Rhizobium etli CNPAF512]